MRPLVPLKPALTIATLAVLLKAPDAIPAFQDYRVLDFANLPAVLDFVPRTVSAAPVEDEMNRLRPDKDQSNYAIFRVSAEGSSLEGFFEALRAAELKKGRVRVVHYGDSPTTADLITGDTRRLLQAQFGDAGHGFVLVAKPWAWYDHAGVSISASGWEVDPSTTARLRDGAYGLGGVSFRGGVGASTRFALKEPHDRAVVWYWRQPGGGTLAVSADGRGAGRVPTDGAPGLGTHEIQFAGPSRRVDLQALGGVRVFGVSFEKNNPGVIYDSLGLNGAYVSVLARIFNEQRWAESLTAARPDLVIINYGTNESVYEAFVDRSYGKELREIIRRIRTAAPGVSILLMSPMDRGVRQAGGTIGTVPAITKIVTIQQQVALETGCGFFNTFQAMGGPGTMGRWYAAEPRLVGADFIHPMPAGARIVGTLLYQSLFDGYNRFKVRKMQERLTAQNTSGDGVRKGDPK